MNRLIRMIRRDRYSLNDERWHTRGVKLEYWHKAVNVGDALSPVIYDYMLRRRDIDPANCSQKNVHLLSVGSVLSLGVYPFDAVVWGSGILSWNHIPAVAKRSRYRKFDIRAVRGPITAGILRGCGYSVPDVFGDPGVLLPEFYPCRREPVEGRISIVHHHAIMDTADSCGLYSIDPRTSDYRSFIGQLCSSERVISSSLHGIILAEAYGVPAVFLQEQMDSQIIKFYDWYYSTGRTNIRIAYSIEEAMQMTPMELPDLARMKETLIASFPYDLFRNK